MRRTMRDARAIAEGRTRCGGQKPGLRAHPEARPESICPLLLATAWITCTGLSLGLCGDGFLHPQNQSFLPHFLTGRPSPVLRYDNRVTNWVNCHARELGFLFDWLETQSIAACAALTTEPTAWDERSARLGCPRGLVKIGRCQNWQRTAHHFPSTTL